MPGVQRFSNPLKHLIRTYRREAVHVIYAPLPTQLNEIYRLYRILAPGHSIAGIDQDLRSSGKNGMLRLARSSTKRGHMPCLEHMASEPSQVNYTVADTFSAKSGAASST